MKRFAFLFSLLLSLIAVPTVFAHDGTWGTDDDPCIIDWIGDFQSEDLDFVHDDNDPFKGWATMKVKNWCGEDWGDFHLKIRGIHIADVDFIVDSPYQPQLYLWEEDTWQLYDGLTWDVDNEAVGAELDLFFYGNPIGHGEKAKISVYTDNTTNCWSFFQIGVCPTPVPEPATVGLLGLGALVLFRKRRK